MAHFARVLDGVVVDIAVVANAALTDEDGEMVDYPLSEPVGQVFLTGLFGEQPGTWLQSSYNHTIRGVYPGIGFTYDEGLDEFVPPPLPEPDPSWPTPPQPEEAP
jgi:hypothetical protein